MSFTVTTYTCEENKYCTDYNGPPIRGAEDKVVKLCEKDPWCVGYYYAANSNVGRICYNLWTGLYSGSKMCTKGTK